MESFNFLLQDTWHHVIYTIFEKDGWQQES